VTLDRFVQKPPVGEPPLIEWKVLFCLQIDASYQRSLETPISESLIRNMASGWDWRLCAPLTVSDRGDSGLFVIDGQHRLEAAKMRSDIKELPCIISRFGGVQDEARLFVEANTLVRKATPLDKFHARVVAGDEEAVEINRIVEAAGFAVGRSPYKIREGEVCCVAVLARLFKQYGGKILSAALVDMQEAWPGQRIGSTDELLPGLCLFLFSPPSGFDPDLFIEVLARDLPIAWFSAGMWAYKQAKEGWPDEVYRDLFRDAYREAASERAAA
jgi:hypothetical protein